MSKKENIYSHLKDMQDKNYNKQLLNTINSFEKARLNLYGVVDECIRLFEMADIDGSLDFQSIREDVNSYRNGEIVVKAEKDKLIIETSMLPPNIYSKSIMQEFIQEYHFIKNSMIKALLPHVNKYEFEKIFVTYNLKTPLEKYDIDNRFFKSYHDAFAQSGLIKCDSVNYLSYAFLGTVTDGETKLIITIKDYKTVEKMLD